MTLCTQLNASTEPLPLAHTTNLKRLIQLVLLCLAEARLFYISEDCTRRERERERKRKTEEHRRVVWNVTLLNLGCCWRKQAAGWPLCSCYCCFQLKLNFEIGHGLALRELLSRSLKTDLHTEPNRKDTSHT